MTANAKLKAPECNAEIQGIKSGTMSYNELLGSAR